MSAANRNTVADRGNRCWAAFHSIRPRQLGPQRWTSTVEPRRRPAQRWWPSVQLPMPPAQRWTPPTRAWVSPHPTMDAADPHASQRGRATNVRLLTRQSRAPGDGRRQLERQPAVLDDECLRTDASVARHSTTDTEGRCSSHAELIGEPQPSARESQPSASESQPSASESQPSASESQPSASESQPSASE